MATARASDDLLCFSAARLVSDTARALVAITRVGEAPVGLGAVRGGSLIVVGLQPVRRERRYA